MKASSTRPSTNNMPCGRFVRRNDVMDGLMMPFAAGALGRRELLGAGGLAWLFGCGLGASGTATAADGPPAFDGASIPDDLRRMGAVGADASQLTLTMPEVAEDGTLVPLTVESRLPGTRAIYVVVDVNPDPVAARFSVPEGTEPFVATRIKMAGDGTVYAVVSDADGRIHVASRSIKVTVGGCS